MNYYHLDPSIEEFLTNIVLTSTQAQRIDKALEDVSTVMLEALETIDIYVQGSFATSTTVKPLTDFQCPGHAGEYDVDIVIESVNWTTPADALTSIKRILNEAEVYSGHAVEVKGKCVRINFPPDTTSTSTSFHVDVVPILNEGGIRKVANGDTGLWQVSDSKRLVEWFEEEKAEHPYLAASTMMIKRIRDLAQLTDDIPSIVIQSISAKYYEDKGTYAGDLIHILTKFEQVFQTPVEQINIPNPVNLDENLAGRWIGKPEKYAAIADMFMNARTVLQDEFGAASPDISALQDILSTDFPSKLLPSMVESLRSNSYPIHSDKFLDRLPIEHSSRFGRLVDAFTRVFFEINKSIVFKAPAIKLSDYEIKWQVLNASGSPSRRGDLFDAMGASGGTGTSSDKHINHENEQYTGSHWIRYFVIADNKCIGRSSKFKVRVNGNTGYN
jgi:Second Messenger Oligonucleotide or Dinucleotide Synthetase domain/Adenylyl/Guanylyl and SMODS C-terminal sensor domain